MSIKRTLITEKNAYAKILSINQPSAFNMYSDFSTFISPSASEAEDEIESIDINAEPAQDSTFLAFSIKIPSVPRAPTVPVVTQDQFEELYEKRRLIHEHGEEIQESLSQDLLTAMKLEEEYRQDSKLELMEDEESKKDEVVLSPEETQALETRRKILREYSSSSISRRNSESILQLPLPAPRELSNYGKRKPQSKVIPPRYPSSRRPRVDIKVDHIVRIVNEGIIESVEYFDLTAVGQRREKKRSHRPFEPRIVYDCASRHSTPYSTRTELDKTLLFESRFQSGNLSTAKQTGKYEYELNIQPDTKTSYFILSSSNAF